MVSFRSIQFLTVLLITFSTLFPFLISAVPPVNPQRAAKAEDIDKSIKIEPYTWEQINDEEVRGNEINVRQVHIAN